MAQPQSNTAEKASSTLHHKEEPQVSVVIPTRNSGRYIRKCLESVEAQTVRAIETIVCDNGSSDDTARTVQELGAMFVNAGPERSAQRNVAARMARGDALLFIDSDMELHPQVIEACVAEWLAGARVISIPEVVVGKGMWARGREWEKRLFEGVPGYEAARFVDRSLFLRVGGYDERLVAGEDFDLHQGLLASGARESSARAVIYHNEHGLRFADYVRKWQYYACHVDPLVAKRAEVPRRPPPVPRVLWQRRYMVARDPFAFLSFVVLKLTEFATFGWRLRFRHCERETAHAPSR